jgi:hypothetical protein
MKKSELGPVPFFVTPLVLVITEAALKFETANVFTFLLHYLSFS